MEDENELLKEKVQILEESSVSFIRMNNSFSYLFLANGVNVIRLCVLQSKLSGVYHCKKADPSSVNHSSEQRKKW